MSSPQSSPHLAFSEIASNLRANGLQCLGSFELDSGETAVPGRKNQPAAIMMIGNVGSVIWSYYDTARQFNPGLTLDQWTENTVSETATEFGLDAVYPFKGPPYFPFIQWAKRTGTLFSSPIGLTIHPVYGLWIAFRAALLFDYPIKEPKAEIRSPCDDCIGRPCLSACPVGAFTKEGYDFETCLNHVASPDNGCRQEGCLARIACPIGQQHRYRKTHANFHMQQLLQAHKKA